MQPGNQLYEFYRKEEENKDPETMYHSSAEVPQSAANSSNRYPEILVAESPTNIMPSNGLHSLNNEDLRQLMSANGNSSADFQVLNNGKQPEQTVTFENPKKKEDRKVNKVQLKSDFRHEKQ